MKLIFAAAAMSLFTACVADTTTHDEELGTTASDLSWNFCAFKPWRSCSLDSQCDAGEMCWFNVCRIDPRRARCESDTVSRNAGGDREDCGGYRCNPSTGKCFTSCTSGGGQCSGTACDVTRGQCGTLSGSGFHAWSTKLPLPGVAPDRETSTYCSTKTCAVDADCGDTFKFMCKNGRCLANVPHCTADRRAQVNWSGVSDCSPTTCSDLDGRCLTQCYSSLHCQGTSCQMDPTGTCGL
jgi:hypothetical protein